MPMKPCSRTTVRWWWNLMVFEVGVQGDAFRLFLPWEKVEAKQKSFSDVLKSGYSASLDVDHIAMLGLRFVGVYFL